MKLLKVFMVCIIFFIALSGCSESDDQSSSDNQQDILISVKNISIIRDRDRTLDWSHENELIAFSLLGDDGYYDVATMKEDGSDLICLTCDNPNLPNKHISNPAWHPSGEYIVMQVEKLDHFGSSVYSTPGIGFNCDLWLMSNDGHDYYQLTNLITKLNYFDTNKTTGVLHPHFSHDGNKLLWGQLKEPISGRAGGGDWELKMADFIVEEDSIYLENIETFTPGDQTYWYESHGFSINDEMIIFSGSLLPSQDDSGMDIYTFNYLSGELVQLTNTFQVWDEHAHYSPDGSKIVWISSVNDFDPSDWRGTMKTEYFIMDSNSANKTQLTFFNTPDHPHHSIFNGARVICADSAWNAEGNKIMASIAVDDQPYIIEIVLNLIE